MKYIIPLISAIILSTIWYFLLWGHLYHWDSTNFFLYTKDFLVSHLVEPMGPTHYLTAAITQLLRWRFIAAITISILPILLFYYSKHLMGITKKYWKYIIPLLITVLVSISMISPSVGIISFVLVLGTLSSFHIVQYSEKAYSYLLPIAYIIALPLSFAFASAWGVILLLFYIIISNITQKRKLWLSVVGIVISFLTIILWREYLTIVPNRLLWSLPLQIEDINSSRLFLVAMLGIIAMLFLSKYTNQSSKGVICLSSMLIIAICIFQVSEYFSKEYNYRLDYYTSNQQWSSIVDYADSRDNLTNDEQFYLILALNNLGRLGDKLFNYKISSEEVIRYERAQEYQYSLSKAEQYRSIKLYNEAIHHFFQASVRAKHALDNRTIKPLIELNIQVNNFDVARKYLSILDNTLLNKGYVKSQYELIAKCERKANQNPNHNFFVGGRPFLSDLSCVLEEDSSNMCALDYILGGLLLKKDLHKFCTILEISPYDDKNLPRAYQEAVLIASYNSIPSAKRYSHSPELKTRFQEFNHAMKATKGTIAQKREDMKMYKDSWWYYFKYCNL